MHCKIIQLGDRSIRKNEYIDSDTISEDQEWFINSICDYVDDVSDDDRKMVLDNHLDHKGLSFKRNKLTIVSLTDYFENRYSKLRESAKRIAKASLDDFAYGKIWNDIWTINDNYDDKYGDYIYYDGCLFTIDDFIRYHEGESFYVGGVVDYHY